MNLSPIRTHHHSPFPALIRIDALGAVDATGWACSPCSVLVDLSADVGSVLAIGTPEQVASHLAAKSPELVCLRREHSVLIPGLVNAHTHLDLTAVGPQPHEPSRGFVEWVEMVRRSRPQEEADIASAVHRGIELSLAGGVVAIGDIAGAPGGRLNPSAWRAARDSGLFGISFLEFFAIGHGERRAMDMLDRVIPELAIEARACRERGTGFDVGLQPHAPNTVARSAYRRAIEHALTLAGSGRPILSTHLAETAEERQFVAHATGPQREMLERFGLWSDAILNDIGQGNHSVAHLSQVLAQAQFLVAHVNDASDAAILTLAETRTCVAYCPRASAYFAAERSFGPHRYRDMLQAGVPVALGTDSIINLPFGSDRISTLDEMRLLFERDGLDPLMALAMGTTHGAAALRLTPELFRFISGPMAGIVAIEIESPNSAVCPDATSLMQSVLRSRHRPELLFGGKKCGETGIARSVGTNRA